jgi:hypothetical protein
VTNRFSAIHVAILVGVVVGVIALSGLARALGLGRWVLTGLLVPVAARFYLLRRTALMVAADGITVDGRRTPWNEVHELEVIGPPGGDLVEIGLRRRRDSGGYFARGRIQRFKYDPAELRAAFTRFAPATATLSGWGFGQVGQAPEPQMPEPHTPGPLPPRRRSTSRVGVVALVLLPVLVVGGTIGTWLSGRWSDDDNRERDRVRRQLEETQPADILVRSSRHDPASLLKQVQELPSVDAAVPLIEGDGWVSGPDGPLGADDGAAAVASWITGDLRWPYTLVDGTGPDDPHEVVIDQRTAREGKVTVGDTIVIELAGTTAPERFTISGVASLGPLDDICEMPFAFVVPDAVLERQRDADAPVGVLALAVDGVAAHDLLREAQAAQPDADVLDHDALVADRMRRCQ